MASVVRAMAELNKAKEGALQVYKRCACPSHGGEGRTPIMWGGGAHAHHVEERLVWGGAFLCVCVRACV